MFRSIPGLLLLTLLGAASAPAFAQTTPPASTTGTPAPTDVIVKRDGNEIPAKIEEVTTDLVKYRRADNLTGPLFSMLKTDVFMIRYANGTKDVFNTTARPTPAPVLVPEPTPAYYPPPPVPAPAPMTAEDSVFQHVAANGPRIGMTFITPGSLANRLRDEVGVSNVVSQFGWQFETRLFQLPHGPSGLLEFVPLIAGLEQGAFLPSLSMVLGLRGRSGLELGFGPNVSLAGFGMVLAAGHTVQSKYLNVPVNFAFVPTKGGSRFSLLIGFTYKERQSR